MKKKDEFEDVYEDVVIENYGIPVVITDVLVRKHKSTGINMYIRRNPISFLIYKATSFFSMT